MPMSMIPGKDSKQDDIEFEATTKTKEKREHNKNNQSITSNCCSQETLIINM
jgi:hypothetical protein